MRRFQKRSKREKIQAEPQYPRIQVRSDQIFSCTRRCQCRLFSRFPDTHNTMDRKRERYNARARQSVAGGASHKKRKRRNADGAAGRDASGAPIAVIPDPNAEVISLKPLEQKELERRERVRQQVRAPFYPAGAFAVQYRPIWPFVRRRSKPILAIQEKRKRNWKSILFVGYRNLRVFLSSSPLHQEKKLRQEERVGILAKLSCVFPMSVSMFYTLPHKT